MAIEVNGYGTVTNSGTTADILTGATGLVIFVRFINISVYVAAAGGGGTIEIRDGSGGTVIHIIDADETKDIHIEFGQEGYALGSGNDLEIATTGAATTQASASAMAVGFRQ